MKFAAVEKSQLFLLIFLIHNSYLQSFNSYVYNYLFFLDSRDSFWAVCISTDCHEWLLSEQIDILPRLLLPLAGPEEFDEDDMERLPVDLQYLEPDKQREPNDGIRCMLVEAIHQVVSIA